MSGHDTSLTVNRILPSSTSNHTDTDPHLFANAARMIGNVSAVTAMPVSTAYWVVASSVILVCLYKIYSLTMRPKGFPPGPPTIPLVGNLLQVPEKDSHLQFEKWAKEYGDIVSVKFGEMNAVLINTRKAVREIMEKRSNSSSNRPDPYYRKVTGNRNMVLKDNDDDWRRARKMYHLRLNSKAADTYVPYQEFDSLELMNNLLRDPDQFSKYISQYSTSVASTVIYGLRNTTKDSGAISDMKEWMHKSVEAQNLKFIDLYPSLVPLFRLVPAIFSPYKQVLRRLRTIEDQTFMKLLNMAKANLAAGKVYPSFIRDMVRFGEKEDGLTDFEISQNAAHGFAAAGDTQWAIGLAFVKAMALHPHVLAKAQAEVDAVVGPDRLPTWSDRESMPYMRSIIEECLRWAPVGFTGVPHAASRDETYNGYRIAKGTSLMINTWALNNAPDLIDGDPREFDPSRFTDEETVNEQNCVTADSLKRKHFSFGVGRRVCPGLHVAQRGLFVELSRLVWGFDFGKKLDQNGKEIPIKKDDWTDELAAKTANFECSIKPRDDRRAEFMRREWEVAQADSLDEDGNFTTDFFDKVFEGKK